MLSQGQTVLSPIERPNREVHAMTQEKRALDPQGNKPAWFELVDGDAPSAQVSKVDKKLPLLALIVTGVIAVSGTFFATASEQNQGSNQSMPSVSTNAISDVVETNATSGATPAKAAAQSTSTVSVSSSAAPASKLQNPAQGGVKAPTGGEDDEDDEEEEDYDEREDHEREERH